MKTPELDSKIGYKGVMGSYRSALLFVALTLGAAGCSKTPAPPESTATATAPSSVAPTASTMATAKATVSAAVPAPTVPGLAALEKELRGGLPKGSGDYARALALATLHKEGKLSYPELERAILGLKLPPHGLGDDYLMIPVPKPPPPAKFEPKMMPTDWEGTWGEVTMAYWLGALDKELYAKLHRAAHPDTCKHK